MKRMLEVCANSLESALAAVKGGADRIELCSELEVGGVTPSYGLMSLVRERTDLTVNVLVRPRSGSFIYSAEEAEAVLRDICMCAYLGVDGVVIGALDASGRVDVAMCRNWVDYAHRKGLSVTFHRAIDSATDIFTALEDVISLGCDRVLTSGGLPLAYDGRDTLRKLVSAASGRIIVMPGAGINPSNVSELAAITGASEFHSSASKNHTVSDAGIVAQLVEGLM